MTKWRARSVDGEPEPERCAWCRRVMPAAKPVGRPRKFCNQACRQWNWVATKRARAANIGADELIVDRAELNSLRDDLYVLACAVDDIERDLAGMTRKPTAADLRSDLDWLLEAARPLRDREIAAPSTPPTLSS